MCNEIYVPKNAFVVKDQNTSFEEAKPSQIMQERYNRYYKTLTEQGYKPEQAKIIADDRLKLCFKIFMARYIKNSTANEK